MGNPNEGQRSNGESFEATQANAKAQGYNWYCVLHQNNATADAFGTSRTPKLI